MKEIQGLINQYDIPLFWESTYPLTFSSARIFTVVSRTAHVACLLCIDLIGNLQCMIANLNGAIRSWKICKPLLRGTSKVSKEKSVMLHPRYNVHGGCLYLLRMVVFRVLLEHLYQLERIVEQIYHHTILRQVYRVLQLVERLGSRKRS
jgi:hypothetical protein